MSIFAASEKLNSSQRKLLGDSVARFESSWRLVPMDELNEFLQGFLPARDNSLRPLILQDLIAVDLQKRWQQKNCTLLEDYQCVIVGCGNPDAWSAQLILEEWQTRIRHGDRIVIDEYRQRFPRQFPELSSVPSTFHNSSFVDNLNLGNEPSAPLGGLDPNATLQEEVNTDINFDSRKIANLDAVPSKLVDQDSNLPLLNEGYRKLNRIGHGAYGEVWKAEAPGGVYVALKIIKWPLGHIATQTELRALELMKRLRHPFLIQLQAYFVNKDRVSMVLELADQTLADLASKRMEANDGPIPADDLVGYFSEAAEALDYLHSENVIHRDIKPENILLVQGHAKIGDFGLARLLKPERPSVTSTIIGTGPYMAPEVWKQTASRRSDQYALAASYVEMRLGKRVFDEESLEGLERLHLTGEPDLSQVPESERRVIRKALSKEVEERFATCRQFTEALRTAIADDESGPATNQPSRRTTIKRSLALLLGIVAVSVAAVIWIWRGPNPISKIGVEKEVLEINAGQDVSFVVFLSIPDATPINLEIEPGDLSGVEVSIPPWPDGSKPSQIHFSADLSAPQQDCKIKLTARKGAQEFDSIELDVRIEAASAILPQRFQPTANSELISISGDGRQSRQENLGRVYYDRIVPTFISPDHRIDANFVLIPCREPNSDQEPATFYIMENKVTNRLFGEFAASETAHPPNETWKRGAHINGEDWGVGPERARLPVFRVEVEDAYWFAKRLGGNLPTRKQWDKAAGFFDQNTDEIGPFVGGNLPDETPLDSPAIAPHGPVSIDLARKDVSCFGIRHLAGNGWEWTREITRGGKTVPIDPEHHGSTFVWLRGRSYESSAQKGPLKFDEIQQPMSQQYDLARPYTSFRVVLEPKQ